MIEYIKGIIDELTPATATIECNGIGYLLNISLNTYSAIQGKKDVKLYVYETIREDAYILNGFASKKERELFLLLITVPGIGSSTARMILSALTPSELCEIVSTGNDKLLKGVKGIGLKTAQRIIVDLKDKIATISDEYFQSSGTGTTIQPAANKEVLNEAISALTALGFQASASQKVVSTILKNTPEATVENVIKMALKML